MGSGKSSFLASLAGEMSLLGGCISISQKHRNNVAFCEQTPWVINASIRENIVLGSEKPFSDKDFQLAIFASGLGQDLAQFPQGVSTIVGEKGNVLVLQERFIRMRRLSC